ncbi:MAG: hypothetical protein MRY78_03925 [Saprospiraceae bacterium]|nr:hypothetical protein [Saprospiraceae bacterium]
MNVKIFPIVILLLVGLGFSCSTDKLAPPEIIEPGFCDTIPATYDLNVQEIIDNNCAYSGCHLDGAPGNFSTYEGLQSVIASGDFVSRVITQREDPDFGMPPSYVPSDKNEDLTAEQLDIINCWIQGGFPE